MNAFSRFIFQFWQHWLLKSQDILRACETMLMGQNGSLLTYVNIHMILCYM